MNLQPSPSRLWLWLASIACLCAFAVFCWRGPVRSFSGESYDLAMPYASSAALADKHDPYVLTNAAAAMKARGGALDATSVLLYPPSALVALRPLTWLPWKSARILWAVAQVCSFIGLAAGLQRLSGGHLRRGLAGWLFMMCLLLWMPIYTGFALGQVALPVAFLMVWSLVLAEDGKRLGAGLALGLAMALKPQLALAFLPILMLRKEWLASVSSVLVLALFFGIGGARLDETAPEWREHWFENLRAFAHGGYGDVALPWARAQMVQASSLFAAFGWASAVALGFGVAALAGCFWLLAQWRSRARLNSFTMAAGLSLIALLATYHRSYDAVLALVPLAYGLRLVAENRRSVAGWALVVLLVVFLTPGGAGLAQVFPQATANGPWWVQFQAIALLLATCALTAQLLFKKN